MYTEKEVFGLINKFMNNSQEEINKAYEVHRKLLEYIPVELRDECHFRYLEKGGTIGLNLNNYKIYEYHHENKESYRVIYPQEDLDSLDGINHRVDFKFVSIPCVLLEVEVEEFNNFREEHYEKIKKAIEIAGEGKKNDKNKQNIKIQW